MRTVFQFLHLIGSKGVEEWRYQELAALADIDFRMQAKQEAVDYAARLSQYVREPAPASCCSRLLSLRSPLPT